MSVADPAVTFLTVADVVFIHGRQLALFGGADGLRDPARLASAVAQAQMTFGGVQLEGDVFGMAAAYWFHLVANRPFVDGNKRTGLAACLVFLRIHGWTLDHAPAQLHDHTVAVACGQRSKADLAAWITATVRPAN